MEVWWRYTWCYQRVCSLTAYYSLPSLLGTVPSLRVCSLRADAREVVIEHKVHEVENSFQQESSDKMTIREAGTV